MLGNLSVCIMDIGKETIRAKTADMCWMLYSLLSPVEEIEFLTTEVFSNLDLTRVKSMDSRENRRTQTVLRARKNNLGVERDL
jgi:hypothetical protein